MFRPLVFDSHLFVASPEEYMIRIFCEMTSGCFPFSALLGSTVDTCYVRLRRPFGFHTAENCGVSAVAVFSTVVDIPLLSQRQILMVQTVWRTIVTSQLQYASDRRCPCCACRAVSWVVVQTCRKLWFPQFAVTVSTHVHHTPPHTHHHTPPHTYTTHTAHTPQGDRSVSSFTCPLLCTISWRLFRAVYTGTRPGLTPAIRAGKGWRGHRGLAPRCSATQLAARGRDPG